MIEYTCLPGCHRNDYSSFKKMGQEEMKQAQKCLIPSLLFLMALF